MSIEGGYRFKPDQIVIPEEPIDVNIKWFFGQDSVSKDIELKLGLNLPSNIGSLIKELYRRDKNTIKKQKILTIEGRKVVFAFDSGIRLGGVEYDALEAGGFGYQPFLDRSTISAGLIKLDSPVEPTSELNFTEIRPSINRTTVLDEKGKPRLITDKYTFTGGYTLDEATRKVAANLIILSGLVKGKNLPFIVPIPVVIGTYDSLKDPDGKPACFVSWLVPYEGKRTGRANVKKEQVSELVRIMIKNAPRISEALRFLHDQLGLTHNQAVSSNFYSPDDESLPTLLADFGTVFPLSPSAKIKSRAHDLAHVIESIVDFSDQLVGKSNINEIIPYLINKFLYHYLKPNNSGITLINEGIYAKKYILRTIENSLIQAEQKKLFPANIPIYSTWNQINSLVKTLKQMVFPN